MKPNLRRVIVGGFAGTLAITFLMVANLGQPNRPQPVAVAVAGMSPIQTQR